MLKMFISFLMSVVVFAASSLVFGLLPQTHAISVSPLITQVQAGGVGAATQEFIVIYNNSTEEIDISGWCVTNKSTVTIGCFGAPMAGQAIYLPAYKYATMVSAAYASTVPAGSFTSTYTPTNQSSGSITGSSDMITLLDHTGMIVDRHSWSTSLAAGMHYERSGSGLPVYYHDTDMAADWTIVLPGILPHNGTEVDTVVQDVCSNVEGVQALLPFGMEIKMAGECVAEIIVKLDITEVLPNATGSDIGAEFIEIYNPNDESIDLSDYQLYIGPELNDVYDFPGDMFIDAHSYKSFSNSEIAFSLLNSSSRVVLALRNGMVVSDVPAYQDPKDDQSWAYIGEVWQYTTLPTPGAANIFGNDLNIEEDGEAEPGGVIQPCAANQYRSPDTNRCRLITTGSTTRTPCRDGQYRSEETQRCRNIATDAKIITPCDADEERNSETNRCRKVVAAATATPCKEGQERNPASNRCRTITKMPTADYGVLGAKTDSGGNWYLWLAIGGILLLALAYAIWEWHDEIRKFLRKQQTRIIRFARIHK